MKWFACVSVCAILSASAYANDKTAKEVKPAIVWSGTDSNVDKETFVRCTSEEELAAVWMKHRPKDGDSPVSFVPEVDFGAFMVVGVFIGEGGDYGIEVKSVVEETDRLLFRYRVITRQTGFSSSEKRSAANPKVQGYCFAVLPRSAKAVVVEEGSYSRGLGQPLEWKERTKLPAIK